jgi:MFS family permease
VVDISYSIPSYNRRILISVWQILYTFPHQMGVSHCHWNFRSRSLICGVAPSSAALIVGRAIAGIGSAGVFSGAYLLIAISVPLSKRPMFTGLIGGMYGIASVVGPLLGRKRNLEFTFHYLNVLSSR